MADTDDLNVDELKRRARRRLVGAVVLALAAAVFVPMLLESEPKPLGEDVAIKIPPVDDGKFVNRLSDKGKVEIPKAASGAVPAAGVGGKAEMTSADAAADPPAAGETKSVKDSPAPPRKSLGEAEQKVLGAPAGPAGNAGSAQASKPALAVSTPPAAPKTTPAPPPKSAPATPASAATKGDTPPDLSGAFSVQLAAFADDKGANALSNKLKKAGYPAYTEPLVTSKGTLWRVRVGPFPTRDAATSSRDKLKGDGYSGIVAAAR
jgi:DedD protein